MAKMMNTSNINAAVFSGVALGSFVRVLVMQSYRTPSFVFLLKAHRFLRHQVNGLRLHPPTSP